MRNIFNNIGRTSGIEENSLELIKYIFREKELDLSCESSFPILSIDGVLDPNNDFLKNYPTFMTHIQGGKTDDIYLAVESFRMPFKITNLLGIVSKRHKIYLNDTSTDLTEKIIDKFERGSYRGLNIEEFEISNFDAINDEVEMLNLNSIVLVSSSEYTNQLDNINLEHAYYIQITEGVGGHNGTITYTNKDGIDSEFEYLDYDESMSLVTMAMFSTPDVFNCSYNILLNSVGNIYDFYINKTNYLLDLSESEWICSQGLGSLLAQQKQYYLNLLINLDNIKNEVITNKFSNSGLLYAKLLDLGINTEAIETYSCVYVY